MCFTSVQNVSQRQYRVDPSPQPHDTAWSEICQSEQWPVTVQKYTAECTGASRAWSHPSAVGCQKRKITHLLVISFKPVLGINLPPTVCRTISTRSYLAVWVCVCLPQTRESTCLCLDWKQSVFFLFLSASTTIEPELYVILINYMMPLSFVLLCCLESWCQEQERSAFAKLTGPSQLWSRLFYEGLK